MTSCEFPNAWGDSPSTGRQHIFLDVRVCVSQQRVRAHTHTHTHTRGFYLDMSCKIEDLKIEKENTQTSEPVSMVPAK